jgi:hypothetical protein
LKGGIPQKLGKVDFYNQTELNQPGIIRAPFLKHLKNKIKESVEP